MEMVNGQRPETLSFQDEDNYVYHRDTRFEVNRYVCAQRTTQWRCSVEVERDDDGEIRILAGQHNHPPSPLHRDLRTLIDALQRQARESNIAPNLLYEQFSALHPNIHDLLSEEAALQHIRRARQRNRPDLPNTMADLGHMLRNYLPAEGIFRGHIRAADGNFITIFASDEMVERLNTISEIHLSGTDQCLASLPPAAQFLIVHIRKEDRGIPAVYAVLERCTIASYSALWEFLIQLSPQLRQNLLTAVCDCEDTLISSLRQVMPLIKIRLSLYHFIKVITRKWYHLGLPQLNWDNVAQFPLPGVLRVLHFAWALPLVPENRFAEAVDVIETYSHQFENNNEMLVVFILYLRNWVQFASSISVRRIPSRNNDVTEAFSRQLNRVLNDRGLWQFLAKLERHIEFMDGHWNEFDNGDLVTESFKICVRRSNQQLHNHQIHLEQQCLDTRRRGMAEFLESALPKALMRELLIVIRRPAHLDDFRDGMPTFSMPLWDVLKDPEGANADPPVDFLLQGRNPRRQRRPQAANVPRQAQGQRRGRGRPRVRVNHNPYPAREPRQADDRPVPPNPAADPPADEGIPEPADNHPADEEIPDPADNHPAAGGIPGPVNNQPAAGEVPEPAGDQAAANLANVAPMEEPGGNEDQQHGEDGYEQPIGPEFWQEVPPPNAPNIYDELDAMEFDDILVEDMPMPPVCSICHEKLARVVVLPCGHAAFCLFCNAGDDLMAQESIRRDPDYVRKCPMDNAPATGKQVVYYITLLDQFISDESDSNE